VWPALGATATLVVCLFVVTIVNRAARAERPDSMADRIAALANPGSDRHPLQLDSRMLAPRPLNYGPALDSIPEEEAVFALAAVVTREGRVANFELLQSDESDHVRALLDAVKHSRFTPAQTSDGVVAVNVVWLLARTTVKASIDPKDTGSLPPLLVPEAGDVVKPLNGGPARPVLRPARS
jgi:alkylhydroperoxidase family enzyme